MSRREREVQRCDAWQRLQTMHVPGVSASVGAACCAGATNELMSVRETPAAPKQPGSRLAAAAPPRRCG